jgi:hypothetical protein
VGVACSTHGVLRHAYNILVEKPECEQTTWIGDLNPSSSAIKDYA